MSKVMKKMNNDTLHVVFTDSELSFLKKAGFDVGGELDADTACDIVDKLGYNDIGTAADIITKITTNPNW